MFPKRGISSAFYKLAGERALLLGLEMNILRHVTKLRTGRTHTFLSNNAQTRTGTSHNDGPERFYTWANTLLDGREAPYALHSPRLQAFAQRVQQHYTFEGFARALESRSGGFLLAEAFVEIVPGQENKRYNIRLDAGSKYEGFDIVRTGLCVRAASEGDFKKGLYHLLDWEKRNHPDYHGVFVPPLKTPAQA